MAFDIETLRPTYEMIIGEAGDSCAFYIAERLGMPSEMLAVAAEAAYGKETAKEYAFSGKKKSAKRNKGSRIIKNKKIHSTAELEQKFSIGDSVMIYPDKKIGIVCEPINSKGILRVQLPNKKIYINHKRVKLHVKADQLYPEDYDFSIVFDTVEQRKARHEMSRKLTDKVLVYNEKE